MPSLTAEETPPLQENRSEATRLAIERGRAIRVNRENKNVDSKPGMNTKDPIQQH